MDLKKIILEALDVLEEMPRLRSEEDQKILDDLMQRDDWDHLYAHGTRHIANLTPQQKRVIKNYRAYMWNIDPMNAERRQGILQKYRQGESGKQAEKMYRTTDKFKEFRSSYRQRPHVREKKKEYDKKYKENPEVKERLSKYWSEYQKSPEVRARRNELARKRRLLAKQAQSI